MAIVSMMPATFSWYDHSGTSKAEYFKYQKDNLPISGSSGLSVSTRTVDKNGENPSSDTFNKVTFASSNTPTIQYYKTTFDNTGNNARDVYAELGVKELTNDENIKVGITDPVINEKGFTITKTPASNTKTRVYFIPTSAYSSFWYNSNTSSNEYDMNIIYTVGGTDSDKKKMNRRSNSNSDFKDAKTGTKAPYIYYYDVPNNATSFFFCNHWYSANDDNKEWNRTPDITDTRTAGIVYSLTGKNITDSYKLYTASEPNIKLAALNKSYSEVRLSLNGHTSIGLQRDSSGEDENFVSDYYGNTISYAVTDGSDKISVGSKDGIITADAYTGDSFATVTTTITGICGDTITTDTKVYITQTIPQMPVAQNIPVQAGKKVDIYWYVTNKGQTTGDLASSIYWTV
jgi:hypothetical protein